MTKRLALAATAAILWFPANAIATISAGVVLSVNGRHHALQLVNGGHVVHGYRFHGALRGVGLGSRVRIKHSGRAIKHLVAERRRARRVSFLARVVRVGAYRVVLRLGDRTIIRLPANRLQCASRKHGGRGARTLVLVTEIVRTRGIQRVSCNPLSTRPSGGGATHASGTVVELDQGIVAVQTTDGRTLRFAVAASVITNLQLSLCATVTLTYHGSGPMLVADTVQSTGASATGPCANGDNGSGSGAPGPDVVGTITQLTLNSVTISTTSGGSLSFEASLGDIDWFMIGDEVDVTYNLSGDGMFVETHIEYKDQDAVGTVTSVTGGSVTLVDSSSSQTETFTDDPANDTFAGISVGDQVDVSYHNSAAGPVVDSITDNTNSQ